MQPDAYPPQEPFTEIGAKYHADVMRRGAGIAGEEVVHGSDPYQSLCVFPAPAPSGEVLAVMHGGGWTNGYKEWMAFMAPAFTAAGITFVSLGYRLAPRHVFPAGFEDALDGVRWIHENIARYGGDPGRIFVGGHSAGGHYAALMALRDDWQAPRGLPEDIIRGALPISGTYWFGADSGLSMRPRFLGPEEAAMEEPASPMSWLHRGAPSFHIAYGSEDFPHLVRQAEAFDAKLQHHGVDVEVLVLEGCNHLSASYASGDPDGPYVAAAVAWMRGR